jgi:hypothetical protein
MVLDVHGSGINNVRRYKCHCGEVLAVPYSNTIPCFWFLLLFTSMNYFQWLCCFQRVFAILPIVSGFGLIAPPEKWCIWPQLYRRWTRHALNAEGIDDKATLSQSPFAPDPCQLSDVVQQRPHIVIIGDCHSLFSLTPPKPAAASPAE